MGLSLDDPTVGSSGRIQATQPPSGSLPLPPQNSTCRPHHVSKAQRQLPAPITTPPHSMLRANSGVILPQKTMSPLIQAANPATTHLGTI